MNQPPLPHPVALTVRQWQALRLLAQGLSSDQIGDRLGVTPATARDALSECLARLGVETREQAAYWLGARDGFRLAAALYTVSQQREEAA